MSAALKILAATSAALLVGTPSASATDVKLTSSGLLQPAFDRATPNFVTTCVGGHIKVTVRGGTGVTSKVDSRSSVRGSLTATVSLKPGRRTVVRITDVSGTTTHSIRCLPADFPKVSSAGTLPASIPLFGLDDSSGRSRADKIMDSYAIIIDRHGAPIWWRKETSSFLNLFATPDGNLGFGHSGGALEIRTLRGTLVSSLAPAGGDTDAHEAIPTSRGTWLMGRHISRTGADLSSIGLGTGQKVLDSDLVEINSSGKILWSWSSAAHLATSETIMPQITGSGNARVVDLAHANSFQEDGNGGLLASFRNTGAVYRIRLSDGSIDWKLGGTTTAQSLSFLGDTAITAERHLLGQHNVRLMPDGTITLLDNGSPLVSQGVRTARPPRALRIQIDPLARTATLIQTLSDPSVTSSPCCGSARLMSGGEWFVAWGGTPYVRSYDASGNLVFALKYMNPARFTYRATPLLASGITEASVITGMDYLSK
ncbi:unannotated protein [freshwater metagenome]|uniref:Unannotated protein n=1 Tax=freshwater metagenome TaxID=449393 RepID=A0A6J7DKH2_9ZZZZ